MRETSTISSKSTVNGSADIVLVNTPWVHSEECYAVKAGARWPSIRSRSKTIQYYPFPFFMTYAAALCKREGLNTWCYDAIAEGHDFEATFQKVKSRSPRVIVLETSTPSINIDLDFAKRFKEATNAHILLVGPHATAMPEEVLTHDYVDGVALGEYEETVLDLAKHILEGKKLAQPIPGAVTKSSDGRLLNGGRRPLRPDIDWFPYPERDEVPLVKYTDPTCKKYPNVCMISSRGCPYHCIFCVEPSIYYGKSSLRLRSPVAVVDEMEYIMKKYEVQEIYFDDASLTVNIKHVRGIAEEILKRNMTIFWSAMADVKVDKDTLELMRRSGCYGLKFGIESANEAILERINKPFSPEQVYSFVSNCRRLGIYTHGTFMFGLPGETRETMQQTLDFVKRLRPTTSQFAVATPIPGTPFYDMAKKEDWLKVSDWSQFEGGQSPVIEYPDCSRADIVEFVEWSKRYKMMSLLTEPAVLWQYLKKIRRTEGSLGLVKDLGKKGMYVLSGMLTGKRN